MGKEQDSKLTSIYFFGKKTSSLSFEKNPLSAMRKG
jgi:hypothetical protein